MSIREFIALPIALGSLLFLLLAVGLPFELVQQSKKEAHSLAELRAVQAYIDRSFLAGEPFPTNDAIRVWAKKNRLTLSASISREPIACLNSFEQAPGDRYVIGFWAGEWSECLSSPSGSTTLQPNVLSLLKSGMWLDFLLYLGLGMGLGWLAWALGFRSQTNGS